MFANSRPVTSAQTGVHEQLVARVTRYRGAPFRKPFCDWNRAAFDASMRAWAGAGAAPLVIDAGCGVGLSTRHLAARHPDHFVIGVDQSADRLARHTGWPGEAPTNFICVRADLVDYWRLLHVARVQPAKHYILYPNPWPKIGHLGRRWHAHPVFPAIVGLGGELECRSNWRVYIEEFAHALGLMGVAATVKAHMPDEPITPFERKYHASGHRLWRCHAKLGRCS